MGQRDLSWNNKMIFLTLGEMVSEKIVETLRMQLTAEGAAYAEKRYALITETYQLYI